MLVFWMALMSCSGLPLTNSRSAVLPGSIVPVVVPPRRPSALILVAATRASEGVKPH